MSNSRSMKERMLELIKKIPKHSFNKESWALYISFLAMFISLSALFFDRSNLERSNRIEAKKLLDITIKNLQKNSYSGAVYSFENDREKLNEAIISVSNARKYDPDYDFLFFVEGLLAMAEKRYKIAHQKFTEAIEKNPNYYQAYNSRANCNQRMQKYDAALKDYLYAIKLNPSFSLSHLGLGTMFLAQGDDEKALEYFRKCIEIDENNVVAYQQIGHVLSKNGENEDAIKYFKKSEALLVKPTSELLLKKAHIFFKMEKYWLAIFECNRAIKVNKNHSKALFLRAFIYEKMEKEDLAIRDYLETLKLDPVNIFANLNIAKMYFNRGEFDLSLKYYEIAMQINPELPEPHLKLGKMLFKKGKYLLSIKRLENFVHLSEGNERFAEQRESAFAILKRMGR